MQQGDYRIITEKYWESHVNRNDFYCKCATPRKFFLSDLGVPGVRSMGPDVRQSVHPRLFADLTDVTLADEDSNLIPTDDVNRAIPGNVAMQVAPSDDQH